MQLHESTLENIEEAQGRAMKRLKAWKEDLKTRNTEFPQGMNIRGLVHESCGLRELDS